MDDKTIKEIMAETRRKCEFMANTFGVPKEPQNFMELALMREAISETEVKTRQRCIAEYKTLLERVLSEIEARKEVIRHDYKWMDYALDDIQNALGLRKSRRQS